MRRQRRMHHPENDSSSMRYTTLNGINDDDDELFQMENVRKLPSSRHQAHHFENTIEAKVEMGDTLQALALRFHCTVADIKRLNKIDKENEIHARKTIKIPVTVHTVLLGTLPTVHTSGNSSPKHAQEQEPNITRNPLEDARNMFDEKLLVASVNSASSSSGNDVNSIVLNSKLTALRTIYTDQDNAQPTSSNCDNNDATLPLISDILDDEFVPRMRQIPGPPTLAFNWSGSDCDMSWACLFVVILALCIFIPFYLVFYERKFHHHGSTAH